MGECPGETRGIQRARFLLHGGIASGLEQDSRFPDD